jgi:L-arabinose isomerase
MKTYTSHKFWFIVGSQLMYGPEVLEQVRAHAKIMTDFFNQSDAVPAPVIQPGIATSPEDIVALFRKANADPECAGIITWMHTFSPSKMWVQGLVENTRPLLHLHTQFNRDIPWDSIDMDFMNLNQSAHGDREHGFIHARLGTARKVVVGYWQDPEVLARIGAWMRAAVAFADGKAMRVARLGDNMREVAVTDGNKVSAQIQFGWQVNGYGVYEVAKRLSSVTQKEVDSVIREYEARYDIAEEVRENEGAMRKVREQAAIELALRRFLADTGAGAFTTTFEDLEGLPQLPGLAVQRLMEDGFGFGAEGDWKTAALVRAMKVMGRGLPGGTSFMEDYTYHLEPENEMVLGAHMLEVCPSIAAARPRIEVHPLSIGGKDDPARLVFDAQPGMAVAATVLDLGDSFRLVANEVEAVPLPHSMPKLPVARALWKPQPDFKGALELWLIAGGAHHTSFSYAVTTEMLEDWARMAGIECLVIGRQTSVPEMRRQLERARLQFQR